MNGRNMAMIDPSNVISVYSGRPGCMCGCKGKRRFASKLVAQAAKDRGYAIDADEISDLSIKRIVAKLNASPDTVIEGDGAFLETETRYLYARFA
jgi:hypothetical protein